MSDPDLKATVFLNSFEVSLEYFENPDARDDDDDDEEFNPTWDNGE